MQLWAALGLSLMHTKGPTPETITAWMHTLVIADHVGDIEYQLRALWGLWHFHASRGECHRALVLAERFHERAAGTVDQPVGERMVGATLHNLGDQTKARQRLEGMLGRYADSVRRSQTTRFQYDQKIAVHMVLARILWLQGFPERALRTVEANIEDARALGHALSLCGALEIGCLIAIWSGDLAAAERSVTALFDHTARQALTYRRQGARCFHGAVLIARGEPRAGLAQVRAVLDDLRESCFVPYYPVTLGALAQGLGAVGQAKQGLATIDEALTRAERDGERWWIAELLRIKAELVLQAGGPSATWAAEANLRQALMWARLQSAQSLELRCATGLARLWHGQGHVGSARALLQPIYGRFNEGFETPELRAAEELLSRLG
jgi:predicted ATPase